MQVEIQDSKNLLVKIDKTKLYYSLFDILFKREAGHGLLRSISIKGISVKGDLDKLLANSNQRAEKTGPRKKISINNYLEGDLHIRDWDLLFSLKDQVFSAKGNYLNLKYGDELFRVTASGSLLYNTKQEGQAKLIDKIESKIHISGTFDESLSFCNLNVGLRNFDSPFFSIKAQDVNVLYDNKALKLTKIQDKNPYDLSVELFSDQINVNFLSENLKPQSIINFKGDWASYNSWLKTDISGKLILKKQGPDFEYSYEGELGLPHNQLPLNGKLKVDVYGNQEQLDISNLHFFSPKGELGYKGKWVYKNIYPQGLVSLKNIQLGDGHSLTSLLKLDIVNDYLFLKSQKLVLDGQSFSGGVKGLVQYKLNNILFSTKVYFDKQFLEKETISLDGTFSQEKGRGLEGYFNLNSISMKRLKPYLSLYLSPSIVEREDFANLVLGGSGNFGFNKENPHFRISNLNIGSDATHRFILNGYYLNNHFEVPKAQLTWGRNQLQYFMKGHKEGEELNFESILNINKHLYKFKTRYKDQNLSFLGNYGIKGILQRKEPKAFLLKFESDEIPLKWNDERFIASLDLSGRVGSSRESALPWELYFKKLKLDWQESEYLLNSSIALTAYASPGGVNLFDIDYKDDFSRIKGSGNLFYNQDEQVYNSSISLKEVDKSSGFPIQGNLVEAYNFYGAYTKEGLSASLSLRHAQLDRFLKLGAKGVISSDIRLDGSLANPRLKGFIKSSSLSYKGQEIELDGKFNLKEQEFSLYDLTFRRNNLYLNRGLGVFNMKTGSLLVTAGLKNYKEGALDWFGRTYLESGLTIKVDMGQEVNFQQLGQIGTLPLTGLVKLHPIKWNSYISSPSFSFDFTKTNSNLDVIIQNDSDQYIKYAFDSGALSVNLKDDFPISTKGQGSIKEGQIDLSLQNTQIDLNLINYFMPKDKALKARYTVFKKGSKLKGDLSIGGTLKKPQFSGVLKSEALNVLTPYTKADIGTIDMTINLLGEGLTISPFEIPIGQGSLWGEGFMNFNGWGLSDYELKVNIAGENGIPVDYNAHRILGAGSLMGNIRLYGNTKEGALDGKLILNNLVGSLGEKTAPVVSKPKTGIGYQFKLNLEIETGKNNLLVLPNPQINLARITLKEGETLSLKLDRLARIFEFNGTISAEKGEIYYFDRTFVLTKGDLVFNETAESFNPLLDLEAKIDTKDTNGSDVTVYLIYRNSILDEFKPTFRSEPALTEDRIMALFGQSLIPYNDYNSVDLSSLLVATGGMVSQSGFVRPFEKALKDSLNLDTVTIKTEVLENAVLDQLDQNSKYSGSGSSQNLAKYFDNTSFSLGKYVTDKLLISGGLLVDYDELNGVRSSWGGVSLEPDFSIQMETPFFFVTWSYNERYASDDREDDFVAKNAIGLEWQYSY